MARYAWTDVNSQPGRKLPRARQERTHPAEDVEPQRRKVPRKMVIDDSEDEELHRIDGHADA
jgi:hypothetical protein